MSQKVAGMVHVEMNLERGIRASKPRHQSVQKWPLSIFFFLGTGANYNSRNRKKKPADKGQRTRDKEQN